MTGDFQSRASAQGQAFDNICRIVLRGLGCDVPDKGTCVEELGIEVDAEVITPTQQKLWFEFKGSWLGARPGSRRTDTVKKALCNVLLAHVDSRSWPPFVIITSHLPALEHRGAQMVKVAVQSGALRDLIDVNDRDDVARLERLVREPS